MKKISQILGSINEANSIVLTKEIFSKVKMTLMSNIYQQSKLGVLTSLLCATVIFFGTYHEERSQYLLGWYTLFLIVTLVRLIIRNSFFNHPFTKENYSFWRTNFLLGAYLGGLCWGLVSLIIFPFASSNEQTLIILVLAGVTAGAVPILAGVLSAAIGFLLISLAPLILFLALQKMNAYLLFDVAAVVYTLYLIMLSIETHKTIKNTISLKFVNDELIKSLLAAQKTLEHSATHDPLTNVANRHLFTTSLDNAIKRAERDGSILALLYIDIDNFKNVNDVYGHHAGDQLLLAVVDRLKQVLRASDLISRLGGDEFTIILESVSHPESVGEIAKKICKSVILPIDINGEKIKVSISIGISMYPLDTRESEALLKLADNAMYYAKNHGQNTFHYANNLNHFSQSST